jgi:hypothetical protein
LKNDPVRSQGCGKTDGQKTLTTGGSSVDKGLPTSTKLKIKDREYIIDIPADYDPTHPYRLIFSWHQAYGSATGNANGPGIGIVWRCRRRNLGYRLSDIGCSSRKMAFQIPMLDTARRT